MLALTGCSDTPTPRLALSVWTAEPARQFGGEQLGKKAQVAAVLVEEVDPQGWFIGQDHPIEAGPCAFQMDFTMATGTSTKQETTHS